MIGRTRRKKKKGLAHRLPSPQRRAQSSEGPKDSGRKGPGAPKEASGRARRPARSQGPPGSNRIRRRFIGGSPRAVAATARGRLILTSRPLRCSAYAPGLPPLTARCREGSQFSFSEAGNGQAHTPLASRKSSETVAYTRNVKTQTRLGPLVFL